MTTTATIFDEGAIEVVAEALQIIMNTQQTIGPRHWENLPGPSDVATFGLALTAEVVEYCNELGWKPWKNPPLINVTRVAYEFADIIAFMGILANYGHRLGGAGALVLAEAYHAKTQVNVDRINLRKVAGYEQSATPLVKELLFPANIDLTEEDVRLEMIGCLQRLALYTLEVNNYRWERVRLAVHPSDGHEGLMTFIDQSTGEHIHVDSTLRHWRITAL